MSKCDDLEILSLLQPNLLSEAELIYQISNRCPKIKHLNSLSKEKLVDLFRRVVEPLPQRSYRPNRTGTRLTSRRITACLEIVPRERSSDRAGITTKKHLENKRVQPPLEVEKSSKIRITCSTHKNDSEMDKIVIRTQERHVSNSEQDGCRKQVVLKRTSLDEQEAIASGAGGKKSRVRIQWP